MSDESVIVFDNLVQADPQVLGKFRPVEALPPDSVEPFVQSNARGELYRPSSLDDIRERAAKAGECFVGLFQTKR